MPNKDAFQEDRDDLADADGGKPVADSSRSHRPRILLVEDIPDHQRLILHFLRKVKADVTVAGNGQSAVTLALQAEKNGNPFELTIMDIKMPVVDGFLATRYLREAGYKLPVIAVTASAMLGDREKFIAAGGDDYISKPFTASEIAKLVKRWLMPVSAAPSVASEGA
jgi:CheY-like chemotaxis protein